MYVVLYISIAINFYKTSMSQTAFCLPQAGHTSADHWSWSLSQLQTPSLGRGYIPLEVKESIPLAVKEHGKMSRRT